MGEKHHLLFLAAMALREQQDLLCASPKSHRKGVSFSPDVWTFRSIWKDRPHPWVMDVPAQHGDSSSLNSWQHPQGQENKPNRNQTPNRKKRLSPEAVSLQITPEGEQLSSGRTMFSMLPHTASLVASRSDIFTSLLPISSSTGSNQGAVPPAHSLSPLFSGCPTSKCSCLAVLGG